MKRIKPLVLSLLISLISFGGVGIATTSVAAALPTTLLASTLKADACSGLSQIDSSQGCASGKSANGTSAVNHLVKSVVNIVSIIVGIAAVIVVVLSGLRFITSGGDSNRVAAAKNTLIYALIGLFIAALAQVLVHFVLNQANTASR